MTWDRAHCAFGTCSNEDAEAIVRSIFSEAPWVETFVRSTWTWRPMSTQFHFAELKFSGMSATVDYVDLWPLWANAEGACQAQCENCLAPGADASAALATRPPKPERRGKCGDAAFAAAETWPHSAMVSSRERARTRDLARLPRACICAVQAQPIGLRQRLQKCMHALV